MGEPAVPAAPHAVLFACTSNTVRSPMAEGLMRHYLKSARVISAGVAPGAYTDGFAIAAMAEIGIDISDHLPEPLEAVDSAPVDLIISLTQEAHDHVQLFIRARGLPEEFWPTDDPSLTEGNRDQRLAAYREVRDALMRRIEARFTNLD